MTLSKFRDWLKTVHSEDFGWLLDCIADERQRRDICEHGIANGDWCERCNREYKLAASSHEGGET